MLSSVTLIFVALLCCQVCKDFVSVSIDVREVQYILCPISPRLPFQNSGSHCPPCLPVPCFLHGSHLSSLCPLQWCGITLEASEADSIGILILLHSDSLFFFFTPACVIKWLLLMGYGSTDGFLHLFYACEWLYWSRGAFVVVKECSCLGFASRFPTFFYITVTIAFFYHIY